MKFGLAGTGHWARVTHAAALSAASGAELAAVWGRRPEAAQALAAASGATAHHGPQGFDAFLAQVDAVAFAVPPDVQAPLAARAARAGKHLLLEKPIALDDADADALVAAVESAGVASVVFFTLRFAAEIRAWLADENARGGASLAGWTGGHAEWLGDSASSGSPFNTPWRRAKGGLWDVAPHLVSVLWASLGPVTSVTGVAGAGNVTNLVLTHQAGATSTATVTLSAPPAASLVGLQVWGEAGRSVMPVTWDSLDCLQLAIAELIQVAASGAADHPCDVRFGREVNRVLSRCQAQLDAAAGQ